MSPPTLRPAPVVLHLDRRLRATGVQRAVGFEGIAAECHGGDQAPVMRRGPPGARIDDLQTEPGTPQGRTVFKVERTPR